MRRIVTASQPASVAALAVLPSNSCVSLPSSSMSCTKLLLISTSVGDTFSDTCGAGPMPQRLPAPRVESSRHVPSRSVNLGVSGMGARCASSESSIVRMSVAATKFLVGIEDTLAPRCYRDVPSRRHRSHCHARSSRRARPLPGPSGTKLLFALSKPQRRTLMAKIGLAVVALPVLLASVSAADLWGIWKMPFKVTWASIPDLVCTLSQKGERLEGTCRAGDDPMGVDLNDGRIEGERVRWT